MTRFALLTSLAALSCVEPSENLDSALEITEEPTIEATARVLNAMSGSAMEDVTVENTRGDIESTGSRGKATLSVPSNSTFELLLQKDGAPDHLLFGPTADEDFEYITFMATQSLVNMVLSMLGTTVDDGTGVVIVGIDYDDLSPAVGASASIDLSHNEPWVLTSSGAAFGDTIPESGMGMVAFSNVQPGDVSVNVVAPEGADCTAFPGGAQMPEAPVKANQVTVVTFHCR